MRNKKKKQIISAEEVKICAICSKVYGIPIPKDVCYMKDGDFAEYISEQIERRENLK